MNIAIIDMGWLEINQLNPFENAIGGSETWFFQIAEQFSEKACVDVFFNFKDKSALHYKKNNNLFFHDKETIFEVLNKRHYSFIISSRHIVENGVYLSDYIKQNNIADRLYIQVHDLSLFTDSHNGHILGMDEEYTKMLINDDFVTLVALNSWHKEYILKQYCVPENRIICAPNGIDLSMFDIPCGTKDNRILWSSCAERGLDILIDKIYPLVKDHIPDFGIDIAGYNDIDKNTYNIDGKDIRILGKLSKEELYNEQRKHKVWFYPGTFAETFCITLIENIMNDNIVVSPFTYGMAGTLEPFVEEIKCGDGFFNQSDIIYTSALSANMIIKILSNEQYRQKVLNEQYGKIKEYIREKYNWKYSVECYLDNYISVLNSKKQKIKNIYLSMYCNHPLFEQQVEAVKETWANPIINNQVEDSAWYCFTSLKDNTQEEYIDEDTHTIYVRSEDDLYHTYSKMKRAYMLLRKKYDFDVLIRTNTTTYLNLDKIIPITRKVDGNEIYSGWCGYYQKYPNGDIVFQFNMFCGNCYIGRTEMFDKIFFSEYDENILNCKDGDDVIAMRIAIQMGLNIINKDINKNPATHNWNYVYKNSEDLSSLSYEEQVRLTTDPNICLKMATTSVRTKYVDLNERMEKGEESNHMRELHNAYLSYKNGKNKIELNTNMLDRTLIINMLIYKNHYERYLEIGLNDGINFRSIDCKFKESVDPLEGENIDGTPVDMFKHQGVYDESVSDILTYRMTSDEMFKDMSEYRTYDIVFIDGLHTKEQAFKDIVNSFIHLNRGGTIVLHDCLPREEAFQRVPAETLEWNGDVWKILPILKMYGIKFYTVDSDCGCCVIPYQEALADLKELHGPFFEYNQVFSEKSIRDITLGVITEKEFLKKMCSIR